MKTLIVTTPTWTATFQLSSLMQVLSATAAVELPGHLDRNTMPPPATTLLFQIPIIEPLQLGVELSPVEKQLQQGLLSLLAFSPSPDQPTEEDIGPRLEYNFPD